MDSSQRLVFGTLISACLLGEELMSSQQPVMPDLDWKRSKVVLVEFLRAISFQSSLRKHPLVCELFDPLRPSVLESFVSATHSLLQGSGSSLSPSLLSIIENLTTKPLKDEAISRTWVKKGERERRERI